LKPSTLIKGYCKYFAIYDYARRENKGKGFIVDFLVWRYEAGMAAIV
jgi:phage terminase small subunit